MNLTDMLKMPAYFVPHAGVRSEQNRQTFHFSDGRRRTETNHKHNKLLKYIDGWTVINATEKQNREEKWQRCNFKWDGQDRNH